MSSQWGIISDMNNDHVFFDAPVFFPSFDGKKLKNVLELGETLHFVAIIAPGKAKAKYKALRVWRRDTDLPSSDPNPMICDEDLKAAYGKYAKDVKFFQLLIHKRVVSITLVMTYPF